MALKCFINGLRYVLNKDFKITDTLAYRSDSTFDILLDKAFAPLELFITRWNMQTGAFIFPLNAIGNYDFLIDWGDDTAIEHITTNVAEHNYDVAGEYLITCDGLVDGFGFDGAGAFNTRLLAVENWSNNTSLHSQTNNFRACNNLIGFNTFDDLDTSNVTNMAAMFRDASIFSGGVRNWNTSNVTNMNATFRGANSFNDDIDNWDVSNVIDMNSMFNNSKSFNQDISSWDTSSVTSMAAMFFAATAFNQNIGNLNVSNVTNMINMFFNVKLSTANYDALLNGWAAQSVQSNVTFHGGNSQYSTAGQVGRDILTNAPNNWIITADGGLEP